MQNEALTVSQLNSYIAALVKFDERLSGITVRGEISNFKHHSSGHLYFSLKDSDAKISCVMFRGNAGKLAFEPEDGMRVSIFGRVGVYEKGGVYQLYVELMHRDGTGYMYEQYQKLLGTLRDMGYFDEDIKREIPYIPKCIALVTSRTGAAVRDMISVIHRRFPSVSLLLCPVKVQGGNSAQEIAAMIDYINEKGLSDLIIAGRGGGSIEELWAFNERVLAESIHRSQIPVISAVGHETDFTICDFVADKRAATPSVAGEIAVPDAQELYQNIMHLRDIMKDLIMHKIGVYRQKIQSFAALSEFRHPLMSIENRMQTLDRLSDSLEYAMRSGIERKRADFVHYERMFESLSHEKILDRGFCLLMKNGHITDGSDISPGDDVRILTKNVKMDALVKAVQNRNEE